jgi:hypothetical protein
MCTNILPHEHELFVHELRFAYVLRRVIHEDKVDEAVRPFAVVGMRQSILNAYNLNIRCIRELLVAIREHGADGASNDVTYVLTRFHGISSELHLLNATPDTLHL